MSDELDQMLDLAGLHAQVMLIKMGRDELMPLFDLRDADDQPYIIGTPFYGDDHKDKVAGLVRDLIRDKKIVRYSFLSEAWMIVRHKYDPRVSTRPSESADRIEVVIAIATDGVGYKMRRWRIVRGKKGRCVDLALDSTADEQPDRSGRFDNLFAGTRH